MGVLSNQRHELFARALAEGKSAKDAYVSAGYKANEGNASTLSRKQHILNRSNEIKGFAAQRSEVTLESLIEEAAEIQRVSIKLEQMSAATAALTAKAKLAGLWIERGEHSNQNVNYVVSDKPMTEEEWVAEHVTEH